ncbi:unnamed protein product, partial [Tilletia controversa]
MTAHTHAKSDVAQAL